jgi:hypothetical protein
VLVFPVPGGGTSVAKAAGAAMIPPSRAAAAMAMRVAERNIRRMVVMTVSLKVVHRMLWSQLWVEG